MREWPKYADGTRVPEALECPGVPDPNPGWRRLYDEMAREALEREIEAKRSTPREGDYQETT